MRRITLICAAALTAIGVAVVPTVMATSTPQITHVLTSTGAGTLVPGRYIKDTMRFAPRDIYVRSGQMLTLEAKDSESDPHTFTLARTKDLPVNYNAMYSGCHLCQQAQADHGIGNGPPKNPLVQKYGDPTKFDAPGDSLVFAHGHAASVRIDAKPGTTLRFLCILHPWMQGTIHVVK